MGLMRWLLKHHRFLMHQCFSLPFAFLFYSLAKCGYLSLTHRYGVHEFIMLTFTNCLLIFSQSRPASWSVNCNCDAAKHTALSLPPPGTCVFVLEAASWQLSQWAATVRCCSSPQLPSLCCCAAWIAATFTPGRLDSRCCGKPHGI